MSAKLYQVVAGEVSEVAEPVECDGPESVLVAARNPEGALKVAQAYEQGLTDYDNVATEGGTIAVVRYQDRTTGEWY